MHHNYVGETGSKRSVKYQFKFLGQLPCFLKLCGSKKSVSFLLGVTFAFATKLVLPVLLAAFMVGHHVGPCILLVAFLAKG